ncbi:hypothetical protein CDAR_509951 [Caerostris darwini]|uniref:Uncharacterized protein n=1 Tax=Caerostris darwini TaxID=1538125 RepID=A0AAV4TWZ9_9ARAC|nr:hypothetical protein CDAR_509951 [Caerostris darwini]
MAAPRQDLGWIRAKVLDIDIWKYLSSAINVRLARTLQNHLEVFPKPMCPKTTNIHNYDMTDFELPLIAPIALLLQFIRVFCLKSIVRNELFKVSYLNSIKKSTALFSHIHFLSSFRLQLPYFAYCRFIHNSCLAHIHYN